jgi:hypothetical protein
MKTTLTALLIVALASQSFVGSARADDKKDDATPSFKKRGESEKEFVAKVGEAVVKAVRTSPAKLEMAEYKITDPKPNRKVIAIKMNWAGSLTGTKFKSDVKITVDPTDKENWEVLEIEYTDDNRLAMTGKAEKLNALKAKFNR